jgi:hypothetical protein
MQASARYRETVEQTSAVQKTPGRIALAEQAASEADQ